METLVEYNAGKKEEFIVISTKDFDIKKGRYVLHTSKQIERSEAIEKMARAIDQAYHTRNKDYIFHFGILAEAALNSLLEE